MTCTEESKKGWKKRKIVRRVGGEGRNQMWGGGDSLPISFLWVPACGILTSGNVAGGLGDNNANTCQILFSRSPIILMDWFAS